MPVVTWTIQVNRRPEEVWPYLTDFSRHAEWSPKPWKMESLTEGPFRVGSKFRSTGYIPRDPNHVNDVEVTAMEPPRRLAFSSVEKGQVFKNEFRLTPQDGGTRIERTLDMPKPKGALGVVFPLIVAGVVKPGGQKGMNLLKAKMDQGST